MKNMRVVLTICVLCYLLGCATHRNRQWASVCMADSPLTGDVPVGVEARFTGLIIPKEASGTADFFIDFSHDASLTKGHVINEGFPTGFPIPLGDNFTTKQNLLRVAVTRRFEKKPYDRTYYALIGPRPGESETIEANIDPTSGALNLPNGGFGVFWGIYPFVQADVVTIAADGTQFVLECFEVAGKRSNRVFLINKEDASEVKVVGKRPEDKAELMVNERYCEINMDRVEKGQSPIPGSGEIRDFYDRAKALGALAEMK